MKLKFNYNDGGRSKYFTAAKVGDCVTRSIAIALNMDYKEVYDKVANIVGYTPRNGVYNKDIKKVISAFGGTWHPMMQIGSGCKVHLCDGEIPAKGRIICKLSHHLTCVIDNVINDTFDASRNGTRCVYGYWEFN